MESIFISHHLIAPLVYGDLENYSLSEADAKALKKYMAINSDYSFSVLNDHREITECDVTDEISDCIMVNCYTRD